MAKSYTLDQSGRNKYSPFCQLGVYQGGGCKNGFTANTALNNYRQQQDRKKKEDKKKKRGGDVVGACFDTMLPNHGCLDDGGEGLSWSAYYACDV